MRSVKPHAPRPDVHTIGLWHLDGDTDDSSAEDNDGDVLSDGSYVPGRHDEALYRDEQSDVLTVPHDDSMVLWNSDFTLEAWAKPAAHDATISAKGRPVFHFWQEEVKSNIQVPLNQWIHVAVERKDNVFTIYINGQADPAGQ